MVTEQGRTQVSKRDFLSLEDWTPADIERVLELAGRGKRGGGAGGFEKKGLGLVLGDESAQTRTSFEVAMYLHGGTAVAVQPSGLASGDRASTEDAPEDG